MDCSFCSAGNPGGSFLQENRPPVPPQRTPKYASSGRVRVSEPWYTASRIKVIAGGAGNRLLSRSGFPVAFSAPPADPLSKYLRPLILIAAAGRVLQKGFPPGGPLSESHFSTTNGANAIIHSAKTPSPKNLLTSRPQGGGLVSQPVSGILNTK